MRYYQGYKKQQKKAALRKKYIKQNFVLAAKMPKLPLGNLSKVKIKIKTKFLIILAILFLGGIGYCLLISPIFLIGPINLEGRDNPIIRSNINESISGNFWHIFPKNNLFLINRDKIANDLKILDLSIEQVIIKRILLNKLHIKIIDKKPAVTLIDDNKYYYLDKNGLIFKEIKVIKISPQKGTPESKSVTADQIIDEGELEQTLPRLRELSETNISIGKTILDGQRINFLTTIHNQLKSYANLDIEYFEITNYNTDELRVKIKNNGVIYFNWIKFDEAEDQLGRLKVLLKQKIEKDGGNFKVINLKYGEQIYYE